jgi:hypothetical protein
MAGAKQGTAAYSAAFTRGAVLLGNTPATTPATTGILLPSGAVVTPQAVPAVQVVQAKQAKVATVAPGVHGQYHQALPPGSVINPMPVVGQPTTHITPGATHVTIVQVCNIAQSYGQSRGWGCNLSGGTVGNKPPTHPLYTVYVNGNRHYMAVAGEARMVALLQGMAK